MDRGEDSRVTFGGEDSRLTFGGEDSRLTYRGEDSLLAYCGEFKSMKMRLEDFHLIRQQFNAFQFCNKIPWISILLTSFYHFQFAISLSISI